MARSRAEREPGSDDNLSFYNTDLLEMSGRVDQIDEGLARNARRPSGGLYVASVEKAFEILQVLSSSPVPLGLSEVVNLSGMGKSSAQRFLHTLHALGFANQNEQSRAYSISPRVLDLAANFLSASGMKAKAAPLLRAANLESEETVNLTVMDGYHIVYLLRYPSIHGINFDLSIGSRLPAYCTSGGRVMLAFMAEAEARRILERSEMKAFTRNTLTNKSKILENLKTIRAEGYFLSNQEVFVGDLSIAAPVFDYAGKVVFAVNISVPTSRWNIRDVQKRLMPIVVETAKSISEELGHNVQ